MVNHRTAVVSQIRGLLLDRGSAIAKSITRARRAIPEILADLKNELTAMAREALSELYDLFRDLDRRIASLGNFATRQDLKDSANLADVNAGKDTWPPEKIACQPISTPQRSRLTNRFRPKRGRNEYFHNRETHPIDR